MDNFENIKAKAQAIVSLITDPSVGIMRKQAARKELDKVVGVASHATDILRAELYKHFREPKVVKEMKDSLSVTMTEKEHTRIAAAVNGGPVAPEDARVLEYLTHSPMPLLLIPRVAAKSQKFVLRPFTDLAVLSPLSFDKFTKSLTENIKRRWRTNVVPEACDLLAKGCVNFVSNIVARACQSACARNCAFRQQMELRKRGRDPTAAEIMPEETKAALRVIDARCNWKARRTHQLNYYLSNPDRVTRNDAVLRQELSVPEHIEGLQHGVAEQTPLGLLEVSMHDAVMVLHQEVLDATVHRESEMTARYWTLLE